MNLHELTALNPGERVRLTAFHGIDRHYTVIESARPVSDGGYSLVVIERGKTKRERFYVGVPVVNPDDLFHGWAQ